MKKIINVLSLLFMLGFSQAQTYQPFTPPGGLSLNTNLGTTSQTIQDITSLANKALPAINGIRTGGSDTGTNISAAIANGIVLSNAISSCSPASPNVFYGAVNSSSQMGIASNTQNLRASGNTLPYFNIAAINATVNGGGGNLSDVSGPIGVSGFQNILKTVGTNGIIELDNSKYLTPGLPDKYQQKTLNSDGTQKINEVSIISSVGFKPTVALMNLKLDGATSEYMDSTDLDNYRTIISNIKTNIPSVTNVWPYINANGPNDFVTSDYWVNARTAITTAGGVGIDIPAGNIVLNGFNSLVMIEKQIKWANANNIKTLVLLSPYGLDTPAGYGSTIAPQWRYDRNFLSHVKTVISWLKAADALPTSWAVANYSPIQYYNPAKRVITGTICTGCIRVTANVFGSDNDSVNQTVAYVARWVAENSPTSTYTTMPNMNQSNAVCSKTVLSGYNSSKPVISAGQLGLGSLAYQDYNNVILDYPNLTGGQLSNTFNALSGTQIVWGISDSANAYTYQQYDYTNHELLFKGSIRVSGNITNNNSTLFESGGNIVFSNSGTNGIRFQNSNNTINSWISGDSAGGIQLGKGVYSRINGTLELVNYTKVGVLAINSPSEGQIVNDSTDNVPVIYENGKWYPIQLGEALH